MPTPRDLLVELLRDLVPSCRILGCTESRFKQYSLSVELPGKRPMIVLLPQSLVVKAVSDSCSRQAVRAILQDELLSSPAPYDRPTAPEESRPRLLARCLSCLGRICGGAEVVIRHGEMVHRVCPSEGRLTLHKNPRSGQGP
jgi:hypothetical protein